MKPIYDAAKVSFARGEREPGFEPGSQRWQRCVVPLDYTREFPGSTIAVSPTHRRHFRRWSLAFRPLPFPSCKGPSHGSLEVSVNPHHLAKGQGAGAEEGSRTLTHGMETRCSAVELHPHGLAHSGGVDCTHPEHRPARATCLLSSRSTLPGDSRHYSLLWMYTPGWN